MRRWMLLVALLALAGATGSAAAERVEVPLLDSPVLGPASAPVTMVEFLDFQ